MGNTIDDRMSVVNTHDTSKGRYVLYWMQQSQRAHYNHALEYAISEADNLGVPVIVFFGLTDTYPEANLRHYVFMLEGLQNVAKALEMRGILFILRICSPEVGVIDYAKDASLLITDAGWLRHQRAWKAFVSANVKCRMVVFDNDVIVPVTIASTKEPFSAGIVRPKIKRVLGEFFVPLRHRTPKKSSLGLSFDSVNLQSIEKICAKLKIDKTVKPVNWLKGGTDQAKRLLADFIQNRLQNYDAQRNDPSLHIQSDMSPYLHFGQISSLYIALEVLKTDTPSRFPYIEELVIRRELAVHFVYFNKEYDNYSCLPLWAKTTLEAHVKDKRPVIYTLEELESASTYDPYWNAAQTEMVYKGKMHGYMRMYWGKKILEWSRTPEEAYANALYLNNKYFLDGRDPNGYAGVAWCFGKHDRAWGERPIFGKIRFMNSNGLKLKFNIDQYVKNVNELAGKS